MTDYAMIEETVHVLPLGREYKTYRWIGKPYWPTFIGRHPYGTKDLPWPLRRVDFDTVGLVEMYVRTDGANKISAAYWWLRYKMGHVLLPIKVRLILTGHVWGLGYTEQGEEWAWRNLLRKSRYNW